MELTTARKLADLNRRFYEDHAIAFAHRRATPQRGVRRILAMIPGGATVLELGCGDGKAAQALAAGSQIAAYLGLDLSPALLERARKVTGDEQRATAPGPHTPSPVTRRTSFAFALADLTSPDWARSLASRTFDWVLAFSVFHHLPGAAARAQILQTLAGRLNPGGTVVISNWQFTRSERLKRRIVPWTAISLSEAEVEAHDYLLAWERNNQRGLRYVHLLDETEAQQMAEAAGLAATEIFRSDGVTDDLADYVVMRKSM